MEDTRKIKTMFDISVESVISDTVDDKVGEAGTKYNYSMNTSFPELAYSIAGFLKTLDSDPDIKASLGPDMKGTPGQSLLSLIQLYYDKPDE